MPKRTGKFKKGTTPAPSASTSPTVPVQSLTPQYGPRTPPFIEPPSPPYSPFPRGDPPLFNLSPPVGTPAPPAIVPTTTTTTMPPPPPPRARSPVPDRMTEFLSQQAEITRRTEEHINMLSNKIIDLDNKLKVANTPGGHAGIINNIYCSGAQPAGVVSAPVDDGSAELLKQIELLEQEKTKLKRESAEKKESEMKLKLDLAFASTNYNTLLKDNDANKKAVDHLTAELTRLNGEKRQCEDAKRSLQAEKTRIQQQLANIEKNMFEQESRLTLAIGKLMAMNSELDTKLKKCDTDKNGLLAQIKSLTDDATNDLARMKELDNELTALKSSNTDVNAEITQLKQQKQESEAKRTDCENTVNLLKAQIQKLTSEIETLKRQLAESQASQAAASQAHSQLEQKNTEATGNVSTLTTKISELEAELAALKSQQTTSGEESAAKIAELEAEIVRLKAELEKAKASQIETEAAKNAAEAKKKECDEKVAALEKQLTAATSKNDTDIPRLQADLAQKDTEITDLKNQLASIQDQQQKANADKTDLESQKKKCEDDKALLQAEIDKSKLRIQELETEKASKDSELEAVKAQLAKVNSDLAKANDDMAINKDAFDKEREVLKQLAKVNAAGLDEQFRKVEDLEEEKRSLNKRLDEAVAALKKCNEKNKENESKIRQLELVPAPVLTTTTTAPPEPVPTTTTTTAPPEPAPIKKIGSVGCDKFKIGERVNIRGDPSVIYIVKEIIKQPETLDRMGDCFDAMIVKEFEPDSKPTPMDINLLEHAIELRGDDCRRFHPGQFLKCGITTILDKKGEVVATAGIYKVVSALNSTKRGDECNVTMIRYEGQTPADMHPVGSQTVVAGKDLNYFKVIPDPTKPPIDPLANLVAATKIKSPYRKGGTKKRHRTPKKKVKSRTYRRR